MSEEIAEKAKAMGWVPEESWKGDPEKWRPAEEFVERGENIIPILKDRLQKLEEDFKITVSTQKSELARVKKEAEERAKADYEAKLRELDEKEATAVAEGDVKTYEKVKKAKKEIKPPEIVPEPQTNPVFEEWQKKNTWYGTDQELSDYAEFVGAKLAQKNLPAAELYQEVEKKVKATFPQKFTNPNREKEDMAGSSTHAGSTKGKKTWGDVPKKDQEAFYRAEKRVKAAGGELKKEDWLKEYFTEEA